MNDDLIDGAAPTVAAGVVPAGDTPKEKRVTCEFCACKLAPNGDVMAMSPQARTFRDQEEKITKLSKDLVDLQAEKDQIAQELESARAVLMRPTQERKSFLADL